VARRWAPTGAAQCSAPTARSTPPRPQAATTHKSRACPEQRGGTEGESELLACCYIEAIALAAEHDCRRVALPAISTGVYGYPLGLAAEVAIRATCRALDAHPSVQEARFWLFDERAYEAFAVALASVSD
jgi:O-acetyl-ADP-ribose deacetylase (regulator of RNase III)